LHASILLGSSNFELCLCSSDIQANSAKLAEASNLSNVPSEYHKFTDVFSETKAEVLASYCSCDHQINLKEGAQSLVGPIYSLLASKQEAFKEFIKENLNIDFIQPQLSLCTVYWSYLLRRKMVHYASVSTSVVLITFPKNIIIHSLLSLIC